MVAKNATTLVAKNGCQERNHSRATTLVAKNGCQERNHSRATTFKQGVKAMFTNHKGDAILEYVVLGALVIAVVGVVAYTIATKGAGEGNNLATWSDSINVPAAHP